MDLLGSHLWERVEKGVKPFHKSSSIVRIIRIVGVASTEACPNGLVDVQDICSLGPWIRVVLRLCFRPGKRDRAMKFKKSKHRAARRAAIEPDNELILLTLPLCLPEPEEERVAAEARANLQTASP